MMETVIVIDFETTGLSPAKGARATEVAAVRLVGDKVTDHYQSLMNPGVCIPPGIERLTGITNEMVRTAPLAASVIRQLAAFIGDAPLVAHNARFDQAFLEAEYARLRLSGRMRFACSMKLAQLVYPRAPDYKLQTLIRYADIPHQGQFHRALSDAMATASLWVQMKHDLATRHGISPLDHEVMHRIATRPDYWRKLNAANPQGGRRDGR